MGSYSSQFLQRVTNILHVECCLKKLSRAFRECMKQKGSEERHCVNFQSNFKMIIKKKYINFQFYLSLISNIRGFKRQWLLINIL